MTTVNPAQPNPVPNPAAVAAVPQPAAPAPVASAAAPAPVVPAAAPAAAAPTPIVESTRNRKYASAGWEGIFQVSTRLLGEKEIDIDDRDTNILLTLEMKTIEPWEFKFENLHVVLIVTKDGDNKNISIDGKTEGNVILFDRKDKHELFPGAALNRQLSVKTGAFSSKDFNADSALAGLKEYKIDIEYDVIPLVGETRNVSHTQMVFYVADD